ncbi:hypothetical protein BV898_02852, partial [Hypsibius exemplaris]
MAEDIVFAQSFLLFANEAKTATNAKQFCLSNLYNSLRTAVRITFPVVSLSLALMKMVDVFRFSLELDLADNSTPFAINLVQMLWANFLVVRGPAVLWLFSWQLPQWRALRFFVQTKIQPSLGDLSCNADPSITGRRLSLILLAIGTGVHASYMALFWLNKESFFNDAVVPSNSSVNLTVEADPCYALWMHRCIGRATFIPMQLLFDWALFLSQQVHISGILFVWWTVKAMRSLRKEITLAKVNQSVAWSDAAGPSPLADR